MQAVEIQQTGGPEVLRVRELRIEHVYPLNDAAQAHRDLEDRSTAGKLLIVASAY